MQVDDREQVEERASASELQKLFEYTAVTADGSRVEGKASARNELELDRQLERRGLTLATAKVKDPNHYRAQHKLKHDQLISFTTQFSTLLEAGVPMVGGLRHLVKRTKSENERAVVELLMQHLEMGMSLSEALEAQKKSFPKPYRAAVRAGEHSMELSGVLTRQANQLRWHKEIKSQVSQALVYPTVLMTAVAGLVTILLTFLLPKLSELFPKDTELPWPTQVVMAISDFLRGNAVAFGIATVALGIAAFFMSRLPGPKLLLSKLMLKIPRLGELVSMVSTARFASTASDLHAAGCDVILTLQVAGESCGSTALGQAFERVANKVKQGHAIAESLDKEPLVDPLLVQLVAVGEASGELDACLRKLSSCYDEEVPRKVKWALSFLEPVLLIGAAGIVGFILLAAILPIMELYESIA